MKMKRSFKGVVAYILTWALVTTSVFQAGPVMALGDSGIDNTSPTTISQEMEENTENTTEAAVATECPLVRIRYNNRNNAGCNRHYNR